MSDLRLIDGLASADLGGREIELAIGMFDGVHRGHRAVIQPAVDAARERDAIAAVLTFAPHPSVLFRPQNPTRLILPAPTKARLLGKLGVDAVITERFTPELASVEADDFLPWLRRRLPTLRGVHVGDNFRYGKGRRGDSAALRRAGAELGIQVYSAPGLTFNGEPVSSTRIRVHLEAGEIEAANALLGYRYFAEGKVEAGKQLGGTIGFPTLNIGWAPELAPRFGVYAVEVRGERETGSFPAVANYGVRPTVENATVPRLEVHLLDACPFGREDPITVEWCAFLRGETKFGSVDELRRQIARDRDAAAEVLRVQTRTQVG